jgi:hypothetical protein
MNSQNSSKPPSSDSPFNKKKQKKKAKRKRGAQKGHKGHQQQMLEPSKVRQGISGSVSTETHLQ